MSKKPLESLTISDLDRDELHRLFEVACPFVRMRDLLFAKWLVATERHLKLRAIADAKWTKRGAAAVAVLKVRGEARHIKAMQASLDASKATQAADRAAERARTECDRLYAALQACPFKTLTGVAISKSLETL